MASTTKVTTSSGDVKYRARYRAPDGSSREKWFDKKVDAKRFLTSMEHTKLTGAYVDPGAGKVTFEEYAEKWRLVQAHRPATIVSVEANLRLHTYPTLGHRPIGAIQRSEIQAWVKGLDLAPGSVRLVYRRVAGVFRSAVDDRVIPATPCRRIALPETVPTNAVIPTPEQVSVIVDTIAPRYRALVLLGAASGLRAGELLGLTVDRVDWLRRTLTVDRQLIIEPRKEPAFGPPKTKASYRVVPLPAEVMTMLTEHRRNHGRDDLSSAELGGLLFADEHGQPITRSKLAGITSPVFTAAGLPPRTGLHALRHFYASALIRHGESVKVVQERLGHASAQETLDTYSHLWPDSEDRTRAAVSAALVGLSWGGEVAEAR